MNFSQAITKLPANTFAEGLSSSNLGRPDYDLALKQHEHYRQALESCGVNVITLDEETEFPDSTFVEDTAILTSNFAVITNPGAISRQGEIKHIESTLGQFYDQFFYIKAPGTLDGGDICQAEDRFFIGISNRTNKAGADQLKSILQSKNYITDFVDIRQSSDLLHLKSGLAFIGNKTMVVTQELAKHSAFNGYKHIIINENETYSANCIRINKFVLIAQGYPVLEKMLQESGFKTISLAMSEFQKMDGGLSCLSLRFKSSL